MGKTILVTMGKTILVVDKDLSFVDKLRQKYMTAGWQVLCARSKAEAQGIFAATRPDVVVTEVILEHMDSGFCLAWEFKQKYPDVPVIIVSDVAWKTGLTFKLSSAGAKNWIKADAFLDKPVRLEELETLIDTLLTAKAA